VEAWSSINHSILFGWRCLFWNTELTCLISEAASLKDAVASFICAREAVVSTCLDQDAQFICRYTSSCFRDLFVCLFLEGGGGRWVGEFCFLPTFLLISGLMHHDMFYSKQKSY
jgi:hypothetical protein